MTWVQDQHDVYRRQTWKDIAALLVYVLGGTAALLCVVTILFMVGVVIATLIAVLL